MIKNIFTIINNVSLRVWSNLQTSVQYVAITYEQLRRPNKQEHSEISIKKETIDFEGR